MLSFSQYLSRQRMSSVLSSEEILIWLPLWIKSLQEIIQKLKEKNILSLRVHTICIENLEAWQDNPNRYSSKSLSLANMDKWYQNLLFFIRNDISFSWRKLKILGGYPFLSQISGVHLESRLVMRDGEDGYEISHLDHTQSYVGSRNQPHNLQGTLKAKIGKLGWIKSGLTQFNCSISDLPIVHPHAELIWCVNHADQLLTHLSTDSRFANLPKLNDDFPHEQLIQSPRLEIITSSSCCAICQILFKSLRLKLNSMEINLPIVLYANTAYNNTSVYSEMQGSVRVINSEGKVMNTHIQCDVPNCAYPPAKQLPPEFRITKKLSCKAEMDYLCLLNIGGVALMDLIAHGVGKENPNAIHALTYIAPDALIIFAAEKLQRIKNLPPKLVMAIAFLSRTLDNMDMRVLFAWRMTFTEQLHWLLKSYSNPGLRDLARQSSSATNCNFLIEHNMQADTDAALFYKNFLILWRMVTNFTGIYRHMGVYFTESNHERMPLGAAVGPLSEAMRQTLMSAENLKKLSFYPSLPSIKNPNQSCLPISAEIPCAT